jgi:hypothetical protein
MSQGDGTLVGSTGNDNIIARNGSDTIGWLGGQDSISAGNGNDTIDANGKCPPGIKPGDYPNGRPAGQYCEDGQIPGNYQDNINAGNGNDVTYGGGAHNAINVGSGNDTIYGGPLGDTINVNGRNNGTDYIFLGAGGGNTVNTGQAPRSFTPRMGTSTTSAVTATPPFTLTGWITQAAAPRSFSRRRLRGMARGRLGRRMLPPRHGLTIAWPASSTRQSRGHRWRAATALMGAAPVRVAPVGPRSEVR